jgi:DNA (cytosine-5)-methyltransferase 1
MRLAHPEPVPPALGAMSCATGLVYGSVCSGIEAATVAWEPLGWRPAFLAEIEPFPSAVLAHHYPAVLNLGDMTAIDGSAWRGQIDVLVGGTPCQAFSVAGRRRSLDDARGNLALTFVDLADAIDPPWIVWENVPGVLSTRDNAFGCLLGGLAGEDGPLLPPGGKWADAGCVLGPARTVAWRVLDAQHFGLAQRRRRVFVVAGAGGRADPAQVLLERDGLRRNSPPRRQSRQNTAGPAACRAFGGNNTSGPIDVATALNACASASGRMDFETETFVTHSLRGEGFDASEDGTGRGTPLVPVAFDCKASGDVAAGAIAPTLRAMNALGRDNAGGQLAVHHHLGVRRLTPRECERLQGFPDDYTRIPWRRKAAEDCPDGPRYRALGNSMAVPVMHWIGSRIQAAGNR